MNRNVFDSPPDPKYRGNFLDTCAFDPKYEPEDSNAADIRKLGRDGEVQLYLAHSNQKEIDHPNTPPDVKAEAAAMVFTLETQLTPGERATLDSVRAVLIGDGKPEKYAADAQHVFEAGKYGGAYFITTDERILRNSDELRGLCGARIVRPSQWLDIYEAARAQERA